MRGNQSHNLSGDRQQLCGQISIELPNNYGYDSTNGEKQWLHQDEMCKQKFSRHWRIMLN